MLALNSSSQQPRPQGFFLRKSAALIFLGKIAGDKVEYTIIFGGWLPSDVWYQMTQSSRERLLYNISFLNSPLTD